MKASLLFCSMAMSALLFVPDVLSAQPKKATAPEPAILFVDSDPLGGAVILDGKPLPQRTPVLLRGMRPGRHTLDIALPGYAPSVGSVELKPGSVTVVDRKLSDQSFVPRFDPKDTVYINGVKRSYKGELYRLPQGDYRITKSGTRLSIVPIFPGQQLLDVTDTVTKISVAASAIGLADQFLSGQGPSGGLIALYASTGFMILTDTLFNYKKSQFEEEFKVAPIPLREAAASAEAEYGRAQELLALNDLAGASALYTKVLQDYPDSPYFPQALYQLSKIHTIEGDDFLATVELRLILEKYPVPDLYDRSCKSLADLYDRLGDFRQAIGELDKMVFIDPLFTRQQIAEYRASLEKKLGAGGSR